VSNDTLAQALYDANWTFGYRGGLNFNNHNREPSPFQSSCLNNELCASISDKNGNLLFSLSHTFTNSNISFYSNVVTSDGIVVLDSLIVNSSCTNCVVILPDYNKSDSIFHIFHLGSNWISLFNNYFFHTIIKINDNGQYSYIQKNKLIHSDADLDEKIAVVKHANGKDWWIVLNEYFKNNNPTVNNNYIVYLFSEDSLSEPLVQSIGTLKDPNKHYISGEKVFSISGNKFATPINDQVGVFEFNRCNGVITGLSNFFTGNNNNVFNNLFSYSLEFSPNEQFLFVSNNSCPSNCYYSIYQFDLLNNIGYMHSWGMHPDTSVVSSWQMQFAPDDKIYISITDNRYLNSTFPFENSNYLSVINYPDSLGLSAGFEKFKLYLGDSSYVSLGLPNFPNYNLGALSIYEAGAGASKVLCTDTATKGVMLGTPTIASVQYQWHPQYNIEGDTTAQPWVYPDSSMWYYVMLSDTTITNACKTRLDSVWVEVRKCNTSLSPQTTVHSVKVFPNPASNEIKIESEKYKIAHVAIHDIAGKIIPLQLPLGKGEGERGCS
jgi:hypothetical protein